MTRRNPIRKCRAPLILLFLFVAPSLASCSERVGAAPPSSATPIEASSAGLAELFQRECIKQISRDWVGKRFNNILADTCGYEQSGDCTTSVDFELHWEIPTKAHSKVFISMAWAQRYDGAMPSSGPPPGPLRCSLYVTQDLESDLRAAAERVKIDGQIPSGSSVDSSAHAYSDLKLKFKNRRESIILRHHLEKGENFSDFSMSPGRAKRFVNEAQYPWELIYQPELR